MFFFINIFASHPDRFCNKTYALESKENIAHLTFRNGEKLFELIPHFV